MKSWGRMVGGHHGRGHETCDLLDVRSELAQLAVTSPRSARGQWRELSGPIHPACPHKGTEQIGVAGRVPVRDARVSAPQRASALSVGSPRGVPTHLGTERGLSLRNCVHRSAKFQEDTPKESICVHCCTPYLELNGPYACATVYTDPPRSGITRPES